jgi:hypothetical protein
MDSVELPVVGIPVSTDGERLQSDRRCSESDRPASCLKMTRVTCFESLYFTEAHKRTTDECDCRAAACVKLPKEGIPVSTDGKRLHSH